MSYRADKQVIDTHTHTDRYTDRGDDNTRRPKLTSGKNDGDVEHAFVNFLSSISIMTNKIRITFPM